MLKYGIFGACVAVITVAMGVDLLLTEPTSVKWMGLLAIFGGAVVAIRSWAALSIHTEQRTGQQPTWHIQRVLAPRNPDQKESGS